MAKTLRQYRMTFERLLAGSRPIDPEALGVRSKLGGEPTWIQNDETPSCSSCGELMSFVGQLDSIEHDSVANPHRVDAVSPDQQYMFGDVGMIYVFMCFECLETKSVVQCY